MGLSDNFYSFAKDIGEGKDKKFKTAAEVTWDNISKEIEELLKSIDNALEFINKNYTENQ